MKDLNYISTNPPGWRFLPMSLCWPLCFTMILSLIKWPAGTFLLYYPSQRWLRLWRWYFTELQIKKEEFCFVVKNVNKRKKIVRKTNYWNRPTIDICRSWVQCCCAFTEPVHKHRGLFPGIFNRFRTCFFRCIRCIQYFPIQKEKRTGRIIVEQEATAICSL